MAEYSVPACTLPDVKALLFSALAVVVGGHPVLSAIPIDEAEDMAHWVRLPVVDLAAVLDVRMGIDSTEGLERLLEDEHNKRFIPLDGHLAVPYWRLVLALGPEGETNITTFSLVFVFHHAVGDGLSGLAFHRALQAAIWKLPFPVPEPVATAVTPPPTPLLPSLEELYKCPISTWYLLHALYREWLPKRTPPGLWTGAPITAPLRTRIRLLRVPASTVAALNARCRTEKVSVTALIISLVAAAFFDVLPDSATKIIGTAPVSARRWTPPLLGLDSAIGVWLTETPGLRHSRGENMWSAASRTFAVLQHTVSSRGKNTGTGLLAYISSYKKYFNSKLGSSRGATYEVSNLGRAAEQRGLTFSQSACVAGAAIAVCVATADDGMQLAWCWQEGVLEGSTVEEVLKRVNARISAETRTADGTN